MLLLLLMGLGIWIVGPAQQVTDFDGNQYDVLQIGDQYWLKQNLKSLHYSDGELIPDVLSYGHSDSLANIYDSLYTWNAAMRNSTVSMSQGVCPDGWHIPATEEWSALEEFLGGAAVAGGAMKDTGTLYWNAPNTGATNSSGFSALPAGEYDTPNGVFQLMGQYAVFWTSTQVSSAKARERYFSYNSSASEIYDWFKTLNYSIRCIKTTATGMENKLQQHIRIIPNPFTDQVTLEGQGVKGIGSFLLCDTKGIIVFQDIIPDLTKHHLSLGGLPPGYYTLVVETDQGLIRTPLVKSGY